MVRNLYDGPEIPIGPDGKRSRVVMATHPTGKKKISVGVTRAGIVSERFFTNLPHQAFPACDVVELDTALVGLLNRSSPMKTASWTQTAGAATPPGDRNGGHGSLHGSGS
jgi:hypothetical protein